VTKQEALNVLGLNGDPSLEEIKKAYRKKAFECHPDRNKNETDGTRFKQVTAAYEALVKPQSTNESNPFEFFESMQKDFESFFGHTGFGFNQNQTQRLQKKPNPCSSAIQLQDINLGYIPINLNTILLGEKIKIKIQVQKCCQTCLSDLDNWFSCKTCGQLGKLVSIMQTPMGSLQQIHECKQCKGNGWIYGKTCKLCKNRLIYAKEKEIEIEIPKNFMVGHPLIVEKAGHEGWNAEASRIILEPKLVLPNIDKLSPEELEQLRIILKKV
jgi:molecular chaperone DnaJ